jgi:hypothetical protein
MLRSAVPSTKRCLRFKTRKGFAGLIEKASSFQTDSTLECRIRLLAVLLCVPGLGITSLKEWSHTWEIEKLLY